MELNADNSKTRGSQDCLDIAQQREQLYKSLATNRVHH